MLRDKLYPKLASLFNSAADALNRRGVTANQLTMAGAGFSFMAGVFFANSALFIGSAFMGLAGLCDAIDGALARLSGKSSPFGAFLDSTMDRFADGFFLSGLTLHFFNEDEPFWMAVTLGLMIVSFVVSYAKARSENFIEKCSVGMFSRETRYAAIGIGALIPPLLKPLLLIALFGSAWTSYQRIIYTKEQLEKPAPLTDSVSA